MVIEISARIAAIQDRMAQAVMRRGPGAPLRLIAVSKRHPAEAIEAAYALGLRDFGENYAQELVQKREALAQRCPEIRWHMIGPLQRNKVAKVLGVSLIQTVDRLSLAQSLGNKAQAQGIEQDCLVQVNPGEAQKAGVDQEGLSELLDAVHGASHLNLRGLMLIPPKGSLAERRVHFEWLRELARREQSRLRLPLLELSMGMSEDFEEAILAGASMIRVGSAIFGPRPS